MPLIITATDFSDIANNAVHYACKIAAATGATVTVFHTFMIPVSFNDNPMPVMPIEDGKEIAEESMKQLINVLQSTYPDIQINSHVTFGDITESLQDYIEKLNPWLIVIGNSSTENGTYWLGSNLVSEMRQVPSSIMAVSPDTVYKPVKNICFACDLKYPTSELPISELLELITATKANLHILNVGHDKSFGVKIPAEANELREALKEVNPEYHFVENEDVEEGIKDFINLNNIDWLIVTPHKHSFFDSLFRKNHTKEIVRKVHIPTVALHKKDT